ncbi:MAG TPA: HAMP domain-containing sensor histidine kinase [Candidatus Elarobacter sp.]|nr:HAMP domain-containing sensor histidine kinase [Candidatus Elarobacter sp.]
MGSRVLIARVVARLSASYLAILVVVLLVLDAVAFWYLAGREHDLMQPLLTTDVGQAAYAAALRRNALGLALIDLPLLLIAGAASYALAVISVRPLVAAREREARFAAEAAHELRTPLARIASVAQSAQSATDPAARDDAFARIAALAVDASGTISDLLTLVRDERVAPKLSEPVDLGALARASVAAASRDGLRYDVAAEECWVEGDERRLRRLAENLLENANRHARAQVRVVVAPDGAGVALSVEDDGPGVPPELRERIFERFVRGDEDERGSGLGLAICRAIARAHGGDVVLEGASRFVARLPRFEPT